VMGPQQAQASSSTDSGMPHPMITAEAAMREWTPRRFR
jgi:hypothetical protein